MLIKVLSFKRGIMITKRVTIKNSAGIHVRPAGEIIKAINGYKDTISLKIDKAETNITSAIDLIALGLQKGDIVDISVSGPNEKELSSILVSLFEKKFDFPPK